MQLFKELAKYSNFKKTEASKHGNHTLKARNEHSKKWNRTRKLYCTTLTVLTMLWLIYDKVIVWVYIYVRVWYIDKSITLSISQALLISMELNPLIKMRNSSIKFKQPFCWYSYHPHLLPFRWNFNMYVASRLERKKKSQQMLQE